MVLEECIKCGSCFEITFLRGISTVSEARHIRIAFLTLAVLFFIRDNMLATRFEHVLVGFNYTKPQGR